MTAIEWTDATWNPFRGCTKISPGCKNCYAKTFAERFRGVPGHPFEQGFDPRFVPERLDAPLRWKKPRRVFVNSMSDLFHESFSNHQIAAVFGVMSKAPQHTFQVLTKRPERMRQWFQWAHESGYPLDRIGHAIHDFCADEQACDRVSKAPLAQQWPLPNVWLGVSVEDQATADKRIPLLLGTPAAVRFVSAEPLLGPIDFTRLTWGNGDFCDALRRNSYRGGLDSEQLDWLIVGGESGPGARPCEIEWIRSIVRQCQRAHVPVFVKQLGGHAIDCTDDWPKVRKRGDGRYRVVLNDRKGGDPSEWHDDLQVREWPEVRS